MSGPLLGIQLFTYGSLVFPIVMRTVTGRSFSSSPARIRGFERFMLKGRAYPGIIEAESGETDGRVYHDLDEDALARLDHFEADEYDRVRLAVQLDDESEIEAFVYVIPPARKDLLSHEPWDAARFVSERLVGYLDDTRGWMADYVGQDR